MLNFVEEEERIALGFSRSLKCSLQMTKGVEGEAKGLVLTEEELELRAGCGIQIHRHRELELIGGETGEVTGVNAAEERAERAERREELLLDWMEREIWILKRRRECCCSFAGES